MKAQVNLDFLMKFFISIVAVILLILSLYYFGANFSEKVFGTEFKLRPPGVYGGNLEVKYEIISNTSKELSYSECVSNCGAKKYSTGMLSCDSFCGLYCYNSKDNKCVEYDYKVKLFVPEGAFVKFHLEPFQGQEYVKEVYAGPNTFDLVFLGTKQSDNKVGTKLVANYLGSKYYVDTEVYNSCAFLGEDCSNRECCSKGILDCGTTFTLNNNNTTIHFDNSLNKVTVTAYYESESVASVILYINCTNDVTVQNATAATFTLDSSCIGEDVKFSINNDVNLKVTVTGVTGVTDINANCEDNVCKANQENLCEKR